MLQLLYTDTADHILEHPRLAMLGRSGNTWTVPEEQELVLLPEGATLVSMPGFLPVGYDERRRRPVAVEEPGVWAAAALLPQGYTRTYLPAYVATPDHQVLPLFGYTAVGIRQGRMYAAAVATDENRKWNPRHYNTADLAVRVADLRSSCRGNRIIEQLSHCALEYGCFTAQNVFYRRWEGGIPTTPACNARCLGCLSEAHSGAPSPQNRLTRVPTRGEIVQVALHHLVSPDAIISFGQGCEGDPALNGSLLAAAVADIRRETRRGTVNINTNAGHSAGIESLVRAGLDSMRVTMFSCREEDYVAYHRPAYRFVDVEHSIALATQNGVKVAVNLLVFPGFTDTEPQYRALADFIARHQIPMLQLRNLNLDPEVLLTHFPATGAGMGMVNLLSRLEDEFPDLEIGSYTHPVEKI